MTAATTPGTPPELRSRLRVRIVLAVLSACGLAALAWASFVRPTAHVVYNPSDSVPVGWYRIERANSPPRPLSVGSIVLARLPADVAALAAQRGYLPLHIPLLKRVGAIAPQHVCIVAGQVRIDGVPVAAVLRADRMGRPLSSWPQCRPLAEGELFLLSTTNPASFDSRYFGPVNASDVIGIARPLYLEKQP
ncbi:TPA: S26 family signal peptidase [Citrobacter freundii]|jgi:conjugative transfer signal peptidase TraF|uniref:S26 family signal peptidase n=1 Tax=Gammaproteobacteria TaxID=1236 RepID=UPI00079345B2|nr:MULTISPECIES: S26 family signal peptidase [Gammaproteobacteria]MBN5418819.1 S26 family signal peptidase [Serratia marcescens]HBV8384428.1 S26 family signal peptidase [Citrobacter freundii]RQI36239.1 peptidase [Pseudomonas aeruginosa]SAF37696.1 conjugal transfer pilin processing protease TraF [Enterobacter hormaechei]HDY6068324.1 S26 family signal peptidase [Pseudomonas aeruginosa]